MGDNPTMQKLKGTLKKTQGKLQEMTGDELGGKIKQVEGETQEKIAELRINHRRRDEDVKDKAIANEQALKDQAAAQEEDYDERDAW